MQKKKPSKKNELPEAFKDHIRTLTRSLKTQFYLGEYEMDLHWEKKAATGCSVHSGDRDEAGFTTIASINHDTRYLNMSIKIYPIMLDFWNRGDDWKIGRSLVHEFCHMLVDPVFEALAFGTGKEKWEQANDIRERQVQRTANVIFDGMPKDWYIRKPAKKKDVKTHKPKRR